MNFFKSNKEKIILILILFIVGVLKFVFFANQIRPHADAYEYLLTAKSIYNSHTPLIDTGGNYLSVMHEPGYPFCIALFYPLFHDFEKSAAFISVLASVFSIFFVYLLMERIEKGSGKFAALLLATSSIHISISNRVLRDIPSLCCICLILYSFYNKQLSNFKEIFLGILIAFASYIHMINICLIPIFLFTIFKSNKLKGAALLLFSFLVIMAPFLYLRAFKWPMFPTIPQIYIPNYESMKNFHTLAIYTLNFLKSTPLQLLSAEPLIMIYCIIGIYLIIKKNIAIQLLNSFWIIYFLSFLSAAYFINMGSRGVMTNVAGDYVVQGSYEMPLLIPFVLIGSITFKKLFEHRQLSRKEFLIIWIIALLSTTYMAKLHMAIIKKVTEKTMIFNINHLKWISILVLVLFMFGIIFSLRKRLFLKPIVMGTICLAFGIQVFDEGVDIKGMYVTKNTGKALSPDINALKGKILPEDAYLLGIQDAMAINYYTDYPLLYDSFAQLLLPGSKFKTNMNRIMKWVEQKPVIFIYDHVYRWYLKSVEKDVYITIQDKYPEKLVFSNLKLNVKIYLLDNTSSPSYYHDLYNKAITYFKNELRKEPNNSNLINYLAWTYYNSGHLEQAIQTWRKRILLEPEYADAYNNIGLAYAQKGEYKKAINEYKKALELKATDDWGRVDWSQLMIYYNLACASEKIDDREIAIENWKNYRNHIPDPENIELMEGHIKKIMN